MKKILLALPIFFFAMASHAKIDFTDCNRPWPGTKITDLKNARLLLSDAFSKDLKESVNEELGENLLIYSGGKQIKGLFSAIGSAFKSVHRLEENKPIYIGRFSSINAAIGFCSMSSNLNNIAVNGAALDEKDALKLNINLAKDSCLTLQVQAFQKTDPDQESQDVDPSQMTVGDLEDLFGKSMAGQRLFICQ